MQVRFKNDKKICFLRNKIWRNERLEIVARYCSLKTREPIERDVLTAEVNNTDYLFAAAPVSGRGISGSKWTLCPLSWRTPSGVELGLRQDRHDVRQVWGRNEGDDFSNILIHESLISWRFFMSTTGITLESLKQDFSLNFNFQFTVSYWD